jgi:hypothetical protein
MTSCSNSNRCSCGTQFRKRLTVDELLSYVEYLREHATFVPSRQVERSPGDPIVTDPDDEYLVHLAQDAQAARIVSGDPDFRRLSQADTPRELIDALLYGWSPGQVLVDGSGNAVSSSSISQMCSVSPAAIAGERLTQR